MIQNKTNLIISMYSSLLLLVCGIQFAYAGDLPKSADKFIKDGKLVITPQAQGKKIKYVLKKTKQKILGGEVAEDIRVRTPLSVEFTGKAGEPVMRIVYENTAIEKVFHKTQTIPKKFLELMSSTSAAMGAIELILSERGRVKQIANLPKIRDNMTVSFEKMVKTLDETGVSQKDRRVFNNSLKIIKMASDENLTKLIEASMAENLRIYYEDYPLKQSQAVEIPISLGRIKMTLQTTYQITPDVDKNFINIQITQQGEKDGVKVNSKTKIKANLALGVITALNEDKTMSDKNGNKSVQVTMLETLQ